MSQVETIRIKMQGYEIVEREIINANPKAGEVFAHLVLKKPHGYITYAADEIYERTEQMSIGIPFLDAGYNPRRVFSYKLRSDRELPQADVKRKTQEKSPCCNRTMNYISQGFNRAPKRYCRKCGNEVPYAS